MKKHVTTVHEGKKDLCVKFVNIPVITKGALTIMLNRFMRVRSHLFVKFVTTDVFKKDGLKFTFQQYFTLDAF